MDQEKPISSAEKVERRRDQALKIRLQTLLTAKGFKQSTFYKSVGLTKDRWYQISWGLSYCPEYLKVKIAGALGVDSRAIWGDK